MAKVLWDKVFRKPASEEEIDRLIYRGQLFINKSMCERPPTGRVWVALRDDVRDFEMREEPDGKV